MKTSIIISGQISGNTILKNAIACGDVHNTMFNGYKLSFPTKKEAKKALWHAFQSLHSEEKGVRYSKFGSLYYDASKAELQ